MVLEEVGVAVPTFIAQFFVERRPSELCKVVFTFFYPGIEFGFSAIHLLEVFIYTQKLRYRANIVCLVLPLFC